LERLPLDSGVMLLQHLLLIIHDDGIGTDRANIDTQIESLHPLKAFTSLIKLIKIIIDLNRPFQVKYLLSCNSSVMIGDPIHRIGVVSPEKT
jgi:hypothetical protein